MRVTSRHTEFSSISAVICLLQATNQTSLIKMSGYDADTSSESECSSSAVIPQTSFDYDLIRLRKMQRNYELLKRLGLAAPTTPTTPTNSSSSSSSSSLADHQSTVLSLWHDHHHRRSASSNFIGKRSSPSKRQTPKSKTVRDFLVKRKSARLSRKPRVIYREHFRTRNDIMQGDHHLPSKNSADDDHSGQLAPESTVGPNGENTTPTAEDNASVISGVKKRTGVFVQGSRVYDPVNGITCHQCRQKTIEKKTECSHCHKGHICARCLLNRYGEVFDQVLQNPNWTCPQCRGICNCSTCLKKKGRSAIGMLIAEVRERGYNSVAEMLAAEPSSSSHHNRINIIHSTTTSMAEIDVDADDEASDYFRGANYPLILPNIRTSSVLQQNPSSAS